MSHWAAIRIGIVGFAGISSVLTPGDPAAGAAVGWEAVAVGFLFFPVIVCIGLCILLPFRGAKLKWETPVWNCNPFDISHPEQFFHLAGYATLATGSGLLVAEGGRSDGNLVYACAVVSLGAGVLLGLRILGGVAKRQVK